MTPRLGERVFLAPSAALPGDVAARPLSLGDGVVTGEIAARCVRLENEYLAARPAEASAR